MNAKELRKIIEKVGLTARGAANTLGIHERTLHRYLAGEAPVPRSVALAVRGIVMQRITFAAIAFVKAIDTDAQIAAVSKQALDEWTDLADAVITYRSSVNQ